MEIYRFEFSDPTTFYCPGTPAEEQERMLAENKIRFQERMHDIFDDLFDKLKVAIIFGLVFFLLVVASKGNGSDGFFYIPITYPVPVLTGR